MESFSLQESADQERDKASKESYKKDDDRIPQWAPGHTVSIYDDDDEFAGEAGKQGVAPLIAFREMKEKGLINDKLDQTKQDNS